MAISILPNIYIIIISIIKIPSSVIRTYSLNISVTMLISVLFDFITFWAFPLERQIGEIFDISAPTKKTAWELLDKIGDFAERLVVSVYYFQATLTVFFAYLSFVRPVLTNRIISNRASTALFGITSLMAVLVATLQTLASNVGVLNFAWKNAAVVFCGILQLLAILAMTVFYVLAIWAVTKYNKKLTILSSASQNNSDMLKSVLIYFTPPNLFSIISIPQIWCNVVMEMTSDSGLTELCIAPILLGYSMTPVRS
ncbi:hypothetical protein L596_012201 [Steinernema carpocapsae]|uniref:G-protein coupled receptors family 1 profile domain-containing protein n=1 Tax=Steinernema carpocapsae TaxID=34508 RepID=A0A4U5NWE7_STECR|nr:hypothetical protein L596_012201 [Steinernema carpocapsae]